MAGERWLFTKSQIANTPSRKNDIDSDKELSYRQQAANFIQDMGQKLQVNQLCINTAIVYMHRFYMFHSFARFHRNSIAAASLFLGAKVEEQPRKLEHVITIAHKCLNREAPPLDTKSEAYLERAQELVINEGVLLQTLGFEIKVDHPHTYVVKTCDLVNVMSAPNAGVQGTASKDLAQTSYFLATNSLHLTTLCLQTKPTVVACVCIHLACKWSNWEFPRSKEGKDWFWYVDKDVSLATLEGFTQEFLTILDNCPSRLKRKIMTWKNAAQERDPQAEKRARPSGVSESGLGNFPTMSDPVRHGSAERHGSKSVTSTPVQSSARGQQPTPESRKKIRMEPIPTTTTTSYKDYKERKERERLASGEVSRPPHHRTSQNKPEGLDKHVRSEGSSLEFDRSSLHQRLPDVKSDLLLSEHDHRRHRPVKTDSPASVHMAIPGRPNVKAPPTKERSQPDLQELAQLSSSHHRHKHSHKSKDQSRETRPETGHPPLKLKLSNRHAGTNGNKPDSRSHSATKYSQRPGESVQLTSPSNSVSQKQGRDGHGKNSSHYTAGSLGMVPHSQEAKSSVERPSPTGYSTSQRHDSAYRDSPDVNSHSSSQPASWHASSFNQGSFVSDLSSVGISPSPVKARKRGPSPAMQPRHSPYKHPKKDPPDPSAMFGSQMFTPPSLESGDFKAGLGEYPRFLGAELGAQNPEANGSDVGSPHFPVGTPSKENLNALQMQLQQLIELQKSQIALKQQDSFPGYNSSGSGGYMSDCPPMPPLPGQELGSIPPLPSSPPNLPPPPPPPPPPPF